MATQGIRTRQNYLNRTYFGNLLLQISYRGLKLINFEYLRIKATIPTTLRLLSKAFSPYSGGNYTVSLQYGIPYRHIIHGLLSKGKSLQL